MSNIPPDILKYIIFLIIQEKDIKGYHSFLLSCKLLNKIVCEYEEDMKNLRRIQITEVAKIKRKEIPKYKKFYSIIYEVLLPHRIKDGFYKVFKENGKQVKTYYFRNDVLHGKFVEITKKGHTIKGEYILGKRMGKDKILGYFSS